MSSRRLIFGFHAINARLRQNAHTIDEIYIDENRQDGNSVYKFQAAWIELLLSAKSFLSTQIYNKFLL